MKKTLIILIVFLLCGCTSKLHFDRNYGIRYSILEDDGQYSGITLRLDTKNPDRIASISINASNEYRLGGLSSDIYSSVLEREEENPITYFSNENFEFIRINLYMDEFSEENAKELSEYLGYPITKEMSLRKLLDSDGFAYKNLINEGELCDDISFVGYGHKVDEKYYK